MIAVNYERYVTNTFGVYHINVHGLSNKKIDRNSILTHALGPIKELYINELNIQTI